MECAERRNSLEEKLESSGSEVLGAFPLVKSLLVSPIWIAQSQFRSRGRFSKLMINGDDSFLELLRRQCNM